jgi:hypothetical protein
MVPKIRGEMSHVVIIGELEFEETSMSRVQKAKPKADDKKHTIREYDFVKYDGFNPFDQTGPTPRVYAKIFGGKLEVSIVEQKKVTPDYATSAAFIADLVQRRDYFEKELAKMNAFLEHANGLPLA